MAPATLTRSGDLTPEALQTLEVLMESQLGALFKNEAPSLAAIVRLGMNTVETYVRQGHDLTSQQKFDVAKKLAPLAVNLYVRTGKITAERGEELKKQIAEDVELVEGMINVLVDTANHPAVLATVQRLKAATAKCSPFW